MLTPDSLIAAGFKPFHDPFKQQSMGDWYQKSYQKRVMDDHGTRYFITVSHCFVPMHTSFPSNRHLFTADNQFQRGARVFNISTSVEDQTPAEIEAFFAEVFTALKADHYEKV